MTIAEPPPPNEPPARRRRKGQPPVPGVDLSVTESEHKFTTWLDGQMSRGFEDTHPPIRGDVTLNLLCLEPQSAGRTGHAYTWKGPMGGIPSCPECGSTSNHPAPEPVAEPTEVV